MDVLIRLTFSAIVVSAALASAEAMAYSEEEMPLERVKAIEQMAPKLCGSTAEYKKTLAFLRETKVVVLPEAQARQVADSVSKACDGSAERFEQILTLLKTIGLSDKRSLEMSLEFANQSTQTQINFLEVFNKTFLTEFFDYDYATAVKLAYELSRDYKGDAGYLRDDFLELVKFCKGSENLDLPAKLCAEYSVKLARLSQYHPKGVREPFNALYKELREREDFHMDVKSALEISYNVLRFGPKAPENFFEGYTFALSKEGLDLPRGPALEFALRMASRSFQGSEPPFIPSTTVLRELSSAKER